MASEWTDMENLFLAAAMPEAMTMFQYDTAEYWNFVADRVGRSVQEVKEHLEKLDGIVLEAERVQNQKAGSNKKPLEWPESEDTDDGKGKGDANTEEDKRKKTKEHDIEK